MNSRILIKISLLILFSLWSEALTLYTKIDASLSGYAINKKASSADAFVAFKNSNNSIAIIRADILHKYFNGLDNFEQYSEYEIFAKYKYEYLYLLSNKKIEKSGINSFLNKDIAIGEPKELIGIYLNKFAMDNPSLKYKYRTDPSGGVEALRKLNSKEINMAIFFKPKKFVESFSSDLMQSLPTKLFNILEKEKFFKKSSSDFSAITTVKVPYYLVVKKSLGIEDRLRLYKSIVKNGSFSIKFDSVDGIGQKSSFLDIEEKIEHKNECIEITGKNRNELKSLKRKLDLSEKKYKDLIKKDIDLGFLKDDLISIKQTSKDIGKSVNSCEHINLSSLNSDLTSFNSQIVMLNSEYRQNEKEKKAKKEEEQKEEEGKVKEDSTDVVEKVDGSSIVPSNLSFSERLITKNCIGTICELHNVSNKNMRIEFISSSDNIVYRGVTEEVTLEAFTFIEITLSRLKKESEAESIFKDMESNQPLRVKINFLEGGRRK